MCKKFFFKKTRLYIFFRFFLIKKPQNKQQKLKIRAPDAQKTVKKKVKNVQKLKQTVKNTKKHKKTQKNTKKHKTKNLLHTMFFINSCAIYANKYTFFYEKKPKTSVKCQ